MASMVEREQQEQGSLVSAMNWMGGLSLLLFWLPVIGPLIAGLVGGRKAGTVKRAIIAVFLPALLIGIMVAAGVGYLTHWLWWGVLAGLGGVALSLLNVGPLLCGAVLGGLAAQLARR
jgi:predicted branched-subunit amino acid permease